MRDATARRLSRFHAIVLQLSSGRLGRRAVGNDMLLLTTRGRRTGKTHTVPLLFLESGRALVVIASWGGRDYHPDWYLNLVADPAAVVSLGSTGRHVTARTATGDERTALWRRAARAYPGYDRYQRRTEREIPIVLLEPVHGPGVPDSA